MPPRVMIVEDDLHIALLLQYNLEAEGYEVEHLDRGDAAEQRIAEQTPDLLILDWIVPGTSGIELCRRIRLKMAKEQLPIMMLTARAERADREFAVRLGANDYVTKPFQIGELLSHVRALLPPMPIAA